MSITATDGVRVLTISNNDQTANVVRATEAAEASAASAADALTYAERAETAAAETTSEGLIAAIDQAETARDDAQTYASNAATSATGAASSAETASTILDEINRIEAAATTLPAGSSATVSYDPASSPIMTFNIPQGDQGIPGPQGDQGDPGQSFTLKATVADETALNAVVSPSENDGRIVESTGTVWIYSDSAWSDTGASIVGPAGPAGTTDYEELINVPATFPPSAHNHDTVYVKLTGSTMSGPLAFSRPAQAMITLNNTTNANASPTTIRESNAGDFAVVHGVDDAVALTVEPAGTTITNNIAAVTKEKGDARYLQLGNYADIDRTFATVAEMVASTKNTVGDYVRTLGYLAAGDGGGNDYQIVAAATATADGGSYINLTGISGQAKGLFGNIIHAAKFGAVTGAGDVSAEIDAANDYLAGYVKTTFNGGVIILSGKLEIAAPITLGGAAQLSADTSDAEIKVIAGGTLESGGGKAITVQGAKTIHKLGLLKCEHFCEGWLFDDCRNSLILHPGCEKFTGKAFEIVESSDGCTLFAPTFTQWANSDPEYWDEANITATGVYINGTDCIMIGGHGGYCKTPLEFGPLAYGAEVQNFHPYNGQPAAGDDDGEGGTIPARIEPWAVVNNSTQHVWLRDCMVDNGHIIDNTGKLKIQGGSHNNSAARATLTHPWVRVKETGDGSNIEGHISDFNSSFGIFTGTWDAAGTGLVSDMTYTVDASRGDGRVMEMNRKVTRFIPKGTVTDTNVIKQGDTTATITERYQPGTGDAVLVSYVDGVMIVEDANGDGSLMLGENAAAGLETGTAGTGDNLIFKAGGAFQAYLQTNGAFRPEVNGTQTLGVETKRWGAFLKDLNIASSAAPSSASDTGTVNDVRIDANYIYVCTATDTWKRVALSTW